MGITETLVSFCHQLRGDGLPRHVIEKAKLFALDFIGVASRGASSDSSLSITRFLQAVNGNGEAVVIGTPLLAHPTYAALANGAFAHSLELDDVEGESSLHPGVTVFPAALAAAELSKADGKHFLAAVVAGYEVAIRLGKALRPSAHYGRGFHPTATCGTFGAATAAGKLLGLDEGQLLHAFGIVGSQAAGLMEFLADGAWTKRLHPGWAAHAGLVAALLARGGFTGPKQVLEGKNGFLRAYSDAADPALIVKDLGNEYAILRTAVKIHACCRYMHAAIDAVLELVSRYHLRPVDVARISVGIIPTSSFLIAEPPEQKYHPQNTVDAQFSMPYGAAIALLKRRASLEEFAEDIIRSPEVQMLLEKVKCIEDPELERSFPAKWSGWAEIETLNGERKRARVEMPKGEPENPVGLDEVVDKFHTLATPVFSDRRRKAITEATAQLETFQDIRELTQLLRVEASSHSPTTL
ncbi:MAG: MmgE/PrpD family protein [Acidobacteria bacterium]|nr:MmgE/PrpD family protein [Acidobacteriota bacterium]